MAIVLSTPAIKMVDSFLLLPSRNTNATGLTKDKVGPCALVRDPVTGEWRRWTEGVSGDANNTTAPFHSSAPQLPGPWTIASSGVPTAVIAPNNSPDYEAGEISFSSAYWMASENRWWAWGHVGGNAQPRRVYLFFSTDGRTGLSFERYGSNPVLSEGTAGAFDDGGCPDFKIIVKPGTATVIALYAGRSAPSGVQPTIGRATSTLGDMTSWTKTGEVISTSGAPSWRAGGCSPGALAYDENGRLHLAFVGYTSGNVGSVGMAFSDDDGATWSETGITNPIWSAGGTNDPDRELGDVAQGIVDGDVFVLDAGGANIDSFPTGGSPRLEAPVGAIVPFRREVVRKAARFYPAVSPRAVTSITATGVLTSNVFSIIVRFRALRLNRAAGNRTIYSEGAPGADFDKEAILNIDTDGRMRAWFRTPSGFLDSDVFRTAVPVDDGRWQIVVALRLGSGTWQMWHQRALVATESVAIGTDATVLTKAIGNYWDSALNEPFNGSISDVITILGTAVTWDQAMDIVTSRKYPGGVTATVDFPSGTDSGDVVLVEGFGDGFPRIHSAGSPWRPAPFAPGIPR